MNRACFSLLATAILLLPLTLAADDSKKTSSSSDKMTPQTKLLVMRDLQSERVFVKTPLPMGERGLDIKDGKLSPDQQEVAKLVMLHGFAAKPGDRVVITNVVIREKSILIEINGGGKKHEKWYQHVSVGAGGGMATPGGPPPSLEAKGSSVTLQFDKYVPELTGEQVRAMLAPVFDFKALNQAEAYEKTLPPKVQQAIKDHKVLVGMDREMVVYAKGRPPKKIRDKDDSGVDYEEWIYGDPPQEVDFVRFQGTFVTRLEIMTVDGQKIVRTEKEVDLQSQETELAAKKTEEKPANAPSLLRPGEQAGDTPDGKPAQPTDPPSTNPGNAPHWQIAGLYR